MPCAHSRRAKELQQMLEDIVDMLDLPEDVKKGGDKIGIDPVELVRMALEKKKNGF